MSKQATSGGIGFCGLLALLFIALKLIGIIDWSWLWVLAPIWIPVTLGAITLGIFLCIILVVYFAAFLVAYLEAKV